SARVHPGFTTSADSPYICRYRSLHISNRPLESNSSRPCDMLFKAVSSRQLCSRSKASERRSTKVPTRLISNKAADAHAINSTNELGESESVPATFEGSATRFTAPIIKAWFAISANTRRTPAVMGVRELTPETPTDGEAAAAR